MRRTRPVKFPPLWPLVLAGPSLASVRTTVSRTRVVMALVAALVAASAALAASRGGVGAGVVAALAVATSPATLLLAFDPVSETLFALTVALALLACAAGAPAWLAGVACGLAYLTRYNGARAPAGGAGAGLRARPRAARAARLRRRFPRGRGALVAAQPLARPAIPSTRC